MVVTKDGIENREGIPFYCFLKKIGYILWTKIVISKYFQRSPYARDLIYFPYHQRYSLLYAIFGLIFFLNLYYRNIKFLKVKLSRIFLLSCLFLGAINGPLSVECETGPNIIGYWEKATKEIDYFKDLKSKGKLESDGIIKIAKTAHADVKNVIIRIKAN